MKIKPLITFISGPVQGGTTTLLAAMAKGFCLPERPLGRPEGVLWIAPSHDHARDACRRFQMHDVTLVGYGVTGLRRLLTEAPLVLIDNDAGAIPGNVLTEIFQFWNELEGPRQMVVSHKT